MEEKIFHAIEVVFVSIAFGMLIALVMFLIGELIARLIGELIARFRRKGK